MKMRWIIVWMGALGVLVSAALGASAAKQQASIGSPAALDDQQRTRLLERWRSMNDATRARMVTRFEQLQKLAPDERQRAMQRARRLMDEVEATEKALAPEERAALSSLSREERRRVLRGLFGDDARKTAAWMRRSLTEEELTSIESLNAPERSLAIRRWRRRATDEAFRELGRRGGEIGLKPEAVEAWRASPPEARRDGLISEVRRLCQEYVEGGQLPEGLTQDAWEYMNAGSDEQFVRGLKRVFRRDPSFAIPPERWEELRRRRSAQALQLAALSEPSISQRAERSGLSGRALRQQVVAGRRAEVVSALVEIGRVSDRQRAQLEALSQEGLWGVYRIALERLKRGVDGSLAVSGALSATGKRSPAARRGQAHDEVPGVDRRHGRR